MEDDDWQIVLGRGMGPLELDLDRESIVERLDAAEIEFDGPKEDPTYLELEDGDLELTFEEEEPHRLLQIIASDDRTLVNGQPVIDRRVQEVIDEWGIAADDTLWRLEPAYNDDPRGSVEPPPTPVTDRELIINGTLWVKSYGVGLKVYRGEVEQIAIRMPIHVPAYGSGPLTDAQREILCQAELPNAFDAPTSAKKTLVGWLQTLLTVVCVIAIGIIAWQGVQFQQRWNNATMVEGTVVAVDPPPPATWPDTLTVEYADGDGKTHQVVWKPADVYTTREIGEKVQVHYLPEEPDKPMGPARVRDAAFLVYVPYGIAAAAIYLVLTVLLNVGFMIASRLVPADAAVAE